MQRSHLLLVATMMVATPLLSISSAWAQDDFERPPIEYSKSTPDNAISRLQARLAAGEAKLKFRAPHGYLESFLAELKVPQSSQMLVFSKTSLQRQRITPETPRAIYFNDEMYIGFCQNGEVLEISAADPQLGTVYYTLDQEDVAKPEIIRQTDNCLICHGSSQTQNIPGHVVRSVYSDASGQPILSSGSFRIDQTSPIEQRWGGWYVTGTHGEQKHLGNTIFRDRRRPEDQDVSESMNLTDLGARFDPREYLSPHSDIVALMVLEHQAMGHNLIARANFTARQALHYEAALNRDLGEPADHRWESTTSRIKSAGEPLVKYLLFCEEAKLTARITGTSEFTAEFVAQGPRDKQGRSLRDFDLQHRLFKYPCSYLIYTPSFDALPPIMRDYVYARFWDVLSGKEQHADFAHLTAADRQAILEIIRETKPDMAKNWK